MGRRIGRNRLGDANGLDFPTERNIMLWPQHILIYYAAVLGRCERNIGDRENKKELQRKRDKCKKKDI